MNFRRCFFIGCCFFLFHPISVICCVLCECGVINDSRLTEWIKYQKHILILYFEGKLNKNKNGKNRSRHYQSSFLCETACFCFILSVIFSGTQKCATMKIRLTGIWTAFYLLSLKPHSLVKSHIEYKYAFRKKRVDVLGFFSLCCLQTISSL